MDLGKRAFKSVVKDLNPFIIQPKPMAPTKIAPIITSDREGSKENLAPDVDGASIPASPSTPTKKPSKSTHRHSLRKIPGSFPTRPIHPLEASPVKYTTRDGGIVSPPITPIDQTSPARTIFSAHHSGSGQPSPTHQFSSPIPSVAPSSIIWKFSCNHILPQATHDGFFPIPISAAAGTDGKVREASGLCPSCLRDKDEYEQSASTYREQITLFDRQAREADEKGNVRLAESVRELMGTVVEMWGEKIVAHESVKTSLFADVQRDADKPSLVLSGALYDVLEKATVLQKSERIVLDELEDAGYRGHKVVEKARERSEKWENVLWELRGWRDFFEERVKMELEELEMGLGGAWGRVREMMG